MRNEYILRDPEQRFVGGERVPVGKPLMLTDKQAAHDLRLGNIALKPAETKAADAPKDAPPKRKV